jgi:hypothetical protein
MNEFSPIARLGSLIASCAIVLLISLPVLDKAAQMV